MKSRLCFLGRELGGGEEGFLPPGKCGVFPLPPGNFPSCWNMPVPSLGHAIASSGRPGRPSTEP